jgi:arginase family enzyme
MEEIMKKMAACLCIVIGLYSFVGNVYAEDPEVGDLSREKKSFRNYSGQGSTSVSSFCIEGHVFVLVSGDTSNAQSILQVFEEKNGKVGPKRCK